MLKEKMDGPGIRAAVLEFMSECKNYAIDVGVDPNYDEVHHVIYWEVGSWSKGEPRIKRFCYCSRNETFQEVKKAIASEIIFLIYTSENIKLANLQWWD